MQYVNKGNKMEEISVYAFNKPGEKEIPKIYESLRNGVSRFGWSGTDEEALLDKGGERTDCWQNAFLLSIQKGDWIVHVSVPRYGFCVAGEVNKMYSFEFDGGIDVDWGTGKDFRHCIGIDKNSLIEFDRNDPNVLPRVSQGLKPRGRWQHVDAVDDFVKSLDNVSSKSVRLADGELPSIYHLKEKIPYEDIARYIWETHPNKKLEQLVCELFRGMVGVADVKSNGSGWKSDYGADIIVRYSSGLPIPELEQESVLVIQVKSYDWEIDNDSALLQIEEAINRFKADSGLVVCTSAATSTFLERVEILNAKLGKPVGVLAGGDFARFLIRHGGHLMG